MNREEWLKARRAGIGGSDAAAIAGISPWRSSFDVYVDKTEDFEKTTTEAMKRGTFLEEGVIKWYEDRTGFTVERNPENKIYTLEGNPIIMGTPDGQFIDDEGNDALLEVKTVHFSQARLWGEPGTDAVPDYYIAQVIWYLGIMGYDRADVVALVGGDDLRIYTVRFDEQLFQILVEKANVFWNEHVVPRVPPEIDNSEGARKWLQARYPKEERPNYKKADGTIRGEIYNLHELLQKEKRVKEDVETARAKIKQFIGDDAGVEGDWGRITWKATKGGKTLDGAGCLRALLQNGIISQAQHDDFVKAYTKEKKSSRRFMANFKL